MLGNKVYISIFLLIKAQEDFLQIIVYMCKNNEEVDLQILAYK